MNTFSDPINWKVGARCAARGQTKENVLIEKQKARREPAEAIAMRSLQMQEAKLKSQLRMTACSCTHVVHTHARARLVAHTHAARAGKRYNLSVHALDFQVF